MVEESEGWTVIKLYFCEKSTMTLKNLYSIEYRGIGRLWDILETSYKLWWDFFYFEDVLRLKDDIKIWDVFRTIKKTMNVLKTSDVPISIEFFHAFQ